MEAPYIDVHTHTRKPGSLCVVSYGLGRGEIPGTPQKPFSAGIHPWDAAVLDESEISRYLAYLHDCTADAVGEAGLDYIHGGDRGKQRDVFIAQVEIARSRGLPVMVHCVKAYNDLLAIVKQYPGVTFILHGYTGSPQQTRQAVDAACYFSLGETSLKSPKTVEAIKDIPPDRIFAETDESPVDISSVYEGLAQIKGMQITDLKEQIKLNFNNIFTK